MGNGLVGESPWGNCPGGNFIGEIVRVVVVLREIIQGQLSGG